jgi:hypothetical protein
VRRVADVFGSGQAGQYVGVLRLLCIRRCGNQRGGGRVQVYTTTVGGGRCAGGHVRSRRPAPGLRLHSCWEPPEALQATWLSASDMGHVRAAGASSMTVCGAMPHAWDDLHATTTRWGSRLRSRNLSTPVVTRATRRQAPRWMLRCGRHMHSGPGCSGGDAHNCS